MAEGFSSEFTARYAFSSLSQLFSAITSQRWDLIEHLLDVGRSSIDELCHCLEGDLPFVDENLAALHDIGLFETTQDAGVRCALDVISVRFDMTVMDRHKSGKISDQS